MVEITVKKPKATIVIAANGGGQSDIEGPTLYLIDGDEVEASEQTAEVQALFSDMEYNHFTDKRFAVKTEYPQPYSEYD